MSTDQLRTCNRCGWVHFAVSRFVAESEVAEFAVYFDSLSEEKQNDYYGGKTSSISSYETCHHCGNSHHDFRKAKSSDCPDGCTINPIIDEETE